MDNEQLEKAFCNSIGIESSTWIKVSNNKDIWQIGELLLEYRHWLNVQSLTPKPMSEMEEEKCRKYH